MHYECTSLDITDSVVRLNGIFGPIVVHSPITILAGDNYPVAWINDGSIFTSRYRLYALNNRLRCSVHVNDIY